MTTELTDDDLIKVARRHATAHVRDSVLLDFARDILALRAPAASVAPEPIEALKLARKVIQDFPRSLGFDFDILRQIDAALSGVAPEQAKDGT